MEINRTDESFLSSDGKTRIHYFVYRPSGAIRAVLQISHGMCEHIGRYEEFALFLAENGYVVYGHDHLGHGGSVASKEDLGYFGENSGWQYLVNDVYRMTKIAAREYPYHKIFLFGHSMGSFIARLYQMKHGEKIGGIILSGTSGGNRLTDVGLAAVELWIKLHGKRYRSNTLKKLMFGDYNKRYISPRTPNDWLSRDVSVVNAYSKDELCAFVFTAAGFKDMLTMLKMVSAESWARSVPKNVPVLLFSGDMDPVGDYGKGVRKVYDRLLDAGVEDVKIKLYPEGRHEMLNELNRKEVYEDILAWLNDRLKK